MSAGSSTITLASLKAKSHAERRILGDRYALKGTPREGGLSNVYSAVDIDSGRKVALKVFRNTGFEDALIEESFRRETAALSSLRHPNIVEWYDSGQAADTAEYYIALEWIPQDLHSYCEHQVLDTWDAFFSTIGAGILEGIAFAHSRGVVHRDIKPTNVLITNDGIPKVCDFGISKLRSYLEPGVTLAQYASAPFAPPEADDGSYSFSRDIFAFATLAVATISRRTLRTHAEVVEALASIAAPEPVRVLLRKCLAIESPELRPTNGPILVAELERIQQKSKVSRDFAYLLSLTQAVSRTLAADVGLSSERDIKGFVLTDLAEARVALDEGVANGEERPGQRARFFIYGSSYSFRAVLNEDNLSHLTLISAIRLPASVMDERREEAHSAPGAFCFGGILQGDSITRLDSLITECAEHASARRVWLADRQKLALFSTWQNLLLAKAALEVKRRQTARYVDIDIQEGNVALALSPETEASDWIQKEVRIELEANRFFYGVVLAVGLRRVLVSPQVRNRVDPDELPSSGLVAIDTSGSDRSIERQKQALDVVRSGTSTNPRLAELIADPGKVVEPVAVEVDYFDKSLDPDKQDAVATALGKPDILVVQGPPGTGKTTFITEMVLQTLRDDPGSRILLTSQTHSALDNSLERIVARGNTGIRALRVAAEEDKVAVSVQGLLVEPQLQALKQDALARGRLFLEKRAQDLAIDLSAAQSSLAIEKLARIRETINQVEARITEIEAKLSALTGGEEESEEEARVSRADLEQERGDLIRDRTNLEKDANETLATFARIEADKGVVEYLASLPPEHLRSWARDYLPHSNESTDLKRLLLLHADWEIRFGRNREFKAALVAASNVVAGTCLGVMSLPGSQEVVYDLCIVDEASIATPTEVLVPLSRSRRAILVGDSKQLSPFQDPDLAAEGLLERFNLTRDDQKQTLFNHLAARLPPTLTKMLRTQHRMVRPIGQLISECFYDGELRTEKADTPNRLQAVLKRRVIWRSTSRLPNRASRRSGTSYVCDAEVGEVLRILERVAQELRKEQGPPIEIAVLTGYNAQKERLREAIEPRLNEWPQMKSVSVSSIDAFQGREADVVIFSVSRSDEQGLGFLKEMERINVALSRGREYLVIVGDSLFCSGVPGSPNPLKAVLEYIRSHGEDAAVEGLVS